MLLICLLFFTALVQAQAGNGADASLRFRPTSPAASCTDDQWHSLKVMEDYSNWTLPSLPSASGFTVMIGQWKTTVSSSCFRTEIRFSPEQGLTFANLFPNRPEVALTYSLASNPSTLTETNRTYADDSPRLIVVGASSNFAVYAMCNDVSSELNVFVTYNSQISEIEKKKINKWIKTSKFPLIGPWGAINFEACHLTKTYLCKGGRSAFCESVRRHSKPHHASEESSEEDVGSFFFW